MSEESTAGEYRYGKSPVTGEWFRVTEWEDVGEGKMIALSKEPVEEDEVPDVFRGPMEWRLPDADDGGAT